MVNFFSFLIAYFYFLFQFTNLYKLAINVFDLYSFYFYHFGYQYILSCSPDCSHSYLHFFIRIQGQIHCWSNLKFCDFCKFQVPEAHLYIHSPHCFFASRNFQILYLKITKTSMRFVVVKDLYMFDFFYFLETVWFLLFC
jgi:hypothetical protein